MLLDQLRVALGILPDRDDIYLRCEGGMRRLDQRHRHLAGGAIFLDET